MVLVNYHRGHDESIFVIAVVSNFESETSKRMITKTDYIFVDRPMTQMLKILDDCCPRKQRTPVLDLDCEVMLLKDARTLRKIKYREILEHQYGGDVADGDYTTREVNDQQKESNYNHIKLTFCTFTDEALHMHYFPFVYQEAFNVENNRLLIYDTELKQLAEPVQINPALPNWNLMLEDKDGFNCYSVCRTSDLLVDGERVKII